MTKRIKLADIAREAGVSVTTVSFYINGKAKQYKLSEETCARIEGVIRKYDFVPNIFARAMQQNRTFLIGLLMRGRINSSFWSDIIAGIEDGVSSGGCHLLLAGSHTTAAEELEALRQMRRKGVDAYVVSPVADLNGEYANLGDLAKLGAKYPVVGLNVELPGLPCVFNDDAAGGRLAAEYLWGMGHRRVGFLTDTPIGFMFARFRAFDDWFSRRGTSPVRLSSPAEALERRSEYSSVFCFNDFLAAALCGNAAAAGVRVPEELSVVGYDNLEWLKLLSPRPATVSQHKYELGRAIAEYLTGVLSGGSPEPVRRFIPELVPGDTVSRMTE